MNVHKLPTDEELKLLPKDGGDKFNRLVFEKSLYLRSHAHQKINWYSWGQDAFDLAKITDKPLFLSIGYAACHWCHVMSDRTFDLDDIADLLNDHFVAIKVDRDELPDIDQIYMSATQLLNHHGGWPNSVFCLPTGQPFYAGTYFPPDDHDKGPGFRTLLSQLAESWKHSRSEIDQQAQEIDSVIKKMNHFERDSYGSMQLRDSFVNMTTSKRQQFDPQLGGFGGAPKFPPFATLRLFLTSENDIDRQMAFNTLDAMACSGLYDHVNGGFHRYSTDAEWHCPHFEKMLTDNAQMIELYTLAYQQSSKKLYKKVVLETINHIIQDWKNGDAFIHSIDADSEGVEGLYYTFTYEELNSIFNESSIDGFSEFCDYFQLTKEGNMLDEATHAETGYNILHPKSDVVSFDWDQIKLALVKFRLDNRVYPLKNTVISYSGNALLAYAFLVAGKVFSNNEWLKLGHQLSDWLFLKVKQEKDRVYFDDVVYLLRFFTLSDSYKKNDSDEVTYLWNFIMDQFYDPIDGGAWFSQDLHRTPISRIKDIYDQAVPSPNAVLIYLALTLYKSIGAPQYYKIALDTMSCFMATVIKTNQGCESFWYSVLFYWGLFLDDTFSVQFVDCQRTDDLVNFTIDLVVSDGYFLQSKDAIHLVGLDHYDWKQLTIDPYKARRVDWSDEVIRCASGNVRISGICYIPSCSDKLQIELPICNDKECLPPISFDVPVITIKKS